MMRRTERIFLQKYIRPSTSMPDFSCATWYPILRKRQSPAARNRIFAILTKRSNFEKWSTSECKNWSNVNKRATTKLDWSKGNHEIHSPILVNTNVVYNRITSQGWFPPRESNFTRWARGTHSFWGNARKSAPKWPNTKMICAKEEIPTSDHNKPCSTLS